ncbi:HRDC domain-containing protein [Paenibacillus filicis]|uniref:HRDC domain-containing protein n=1 Tax=Paenibacillus gyeongsangnamensis TaxID=3388067 RepID=A0ABT4QI26_9BACL|nr:HRDC domain-containing protein [Paenibacillus filicis]MCZ8516541.1 HRDC domain-containing protein [Paenibacillus filicis]
MFLNSLEKAESEGAARSAQVSIGEQEGIWYVMWTETEEDGRTRQEHWYEGMQWEEMLAVFRERVWSKQCEGFKPLIEAVAGGMNAADERAVYIQLLQYYSELHPNDELYEALRQWRLKMASKESKAPFIVATNRLLKLISTFVPQSEEELLQLPGFGKAKAAQYAAELLAITAEQERTTSFPLVWVEQQVNPSEFYAWQLQEKERRRKAEADKQELKRKLLEAIHRMEPLDELQEQTKLQRRNLVQWIEELDRDGYELEPYIELLLEQVPRAERELAWQAFEQQGDRYLKPILQTVYKQEELSAKDTDRIYEWLRLLRLKFRRSGQLKMEAAV